MQAKDQLQSAHLGRTVSIAARVTRVFHGFVAASQSAGFFGPNNGGALTMRRYNVSRLHGLREIAWIITGSSLIAFAAEATAGDPATQLEAATQIAPLARIEPGAIAIICGSERGQCSFDKGALRVESSAEGAGDAVATVLQPPKIGHAQLEAAIGVVEFAFSPFAAAYGAITSGQHKLTAAELAEAEQRVVEAMHQMVEQNRLRQFVFEYAPEKTHRRLVEPAADGTRSMDPFSGALETQIEMLQLQPVHLNDQNYRLTIHARARLLKTSKDQVIAERSYEYTSGEGMFIDWSRAGGLESVALTGFRQIAQDIVRDFCSPALEAPIFLGAAYGNPAPRPAQHVRLARRTAPGTPQFVEYRVIANNAFEVFPDVARAEVMIHGPKDKDSTSSDSQTDAEWSMDGLVNHPNFVVQAGACLAAVPMGIWEQTVGAIGRKSQENLSAAAGEVQQVVWKTPLQQNLAGDIARTLAPQTAQPVILRKLPSTSGEGSPTGDLIRISNVGDVALDGRAMQMRPESSLEVRVTKVELSSNHGNKRQPSLSLEARVTLLRTGDGQELFTWPVRYSSAPRRIGAWSAHEGAQVEQELRECLRQIAEAIVAQLLREGCVAPGRMPASAIAKN
jgi:hypothetical protein